MKIKTIILSTLFLFSIHCICANQIPKVAVIGGGGAGLTTAWLLEQDYDVTLFEKEGRLGGHANTIEIEVKGKKLAIDAGFEFFSDKMYPRFNRLLSILKVPVRQFPLIYTFYKTDGGDTVVLPPIHNGQVYWESLKPSNLFDLLQFHYVLREARYLVAIKDTGVTLQQFVDHLDLTDSFKNEFFYPFLAGGWGVPPEVFRTFAAYNALKYMVMNQPTGLQPIYWNEVIGGTISYIQALTKQLAKTSIKLSASIEEVTYANDRYIIVEADGTVSEFDYLVLATNAFEANKLLKYIPETLDVRTLLGKVKYFHTSIAVHGDPRFMPADPSDWSVANVRYDGSHSAMTFYKAWRDSPSPIFRSWLTFDVRPASENGQPLPDPLYGLLDYWHPKVDLQYFETQKAIQDINGNRRLWFAGLYTEDVDAHESAIVSAIRIAEALAPQADRLLQLKKETTPYIVYK